MRGSKKTRADGKSVSVETLLRALADRTRLRLINLMGDAELCVCYFVEVLETNQPKISRHLAYLRRAGVVTARRQGLWMHYRVAVPPDSHAARVLQEVRASLADDPEMQRDRERLKRACCAPEKFVRLQSAPAPAFADTLQEKA
jgi:ArsR family transcriptional regulator, arsenate/arsenite/antimonite-responsive transcriptional repressor